MAVPREPAPDTRSSLAEASDRIAAALQRLAENQRCVFVMRHFEDLSVTEIAQILDMAEGTVRSHLGRAILALRRILRSPEGTRPLL